MGGALPRLPLDVSGDVIASVLLAREGGQLFFLRLLGARCVNV